jgi:hypothetical protein
MLLRILLVAICVLPMFGGCQLRPLSAEGDDCVTFAGQRLHPDGCPFQ